MSTLNDKSGYVRTLLLMKPDYTLENDPDYEIQKIADIVELAVKNIIGSKQKLSPKTRKKYTKNWIKFFKWYAKNSVNDHDLKINNYYSAELVSLFQPNSIDILLKYNKKENSITHTFLPPQKDIIEQAFEASRGIYRSPSRASSFKPVLIKKKRRSKSKNKRRSKSKNKRRSKRRSKSKNKRRSKRRSKRKK